MRGWRAVALASALVCSCAGPPAAPPTAVIDVTPRSVCVGDDFGTAITLSGRRSSARLSLAPDPGETPLAFRWELSGAAHVIVDGAPDEAELTVRTAGDRPLHATLTVTAPDGGGEATSVASLGVTFCDGCGEGRCDAGR